MRVIQVTPVLSSEEMPDETWMARSRGP